MFDWNDLKYFLAVADEGSTLKAAKLLRANQTTVARRISALERALGQSLFERRRSGFTLSDAGERLLTQARNVAAAADALQLAADASNRSLSGIVRVTCNELTAEITLPPVLAKLRESYPDIRVEVDQSQGMRDLAKGEADIALRFTNKLKGDALIARRLFEDKWTIYCSREYAERHGIPKRPKDLVAHRIIGGGGSFAGPIIEKWFSTMAPGVEFDTRFDTLTSMLSALKAGVGVAAMPSAVAQGDPDLIQCWEPEDVGYTFWIVAHERSRDVPHVRAVMKSIGDLMIERAKERGYY